MKKQKTKKKRMIMQEKINERKNTINELQLRTIAIRYMNKMKEMELAATGGDE